MTNPLRALRRTIALALLRRERHAIRQKLFAHVIGGTLVLDLPAYRGTFEIGALSDLAHRIMFDGYYEPRLVDFCVNYVDPRKDTLDIGANVGLYTVLFARLVDPSKRVLAIEPVPKIFELLTRNANRNGVASKVVLAHGVASDRAHEATVNVCVGREEYSSVGALVHPSVAGVEVERVKVPALTVDGIVARNGLTPGFMKIDVEGHEHHVLLGAQRTLREFRPVLLLEVSDSLLRACGSSSKELLDTLAELGYEILDTDTMQPIPAVFNGNVIARPIQTIASRKG